MAARPTWKGFLKVSLVTIPVKVFPATPFTCPELDTIKVPFEFAPDPPMSMSPPLVVTSAIPLFETVMEPVELAPRLAMRNRVVESFDPAPST